MSRFLLVLVISISVFELCAHEKPIKTNCPDKSDGASIFEKNKFQFDTSFYFNHSTAVLCDLLKYQSTYLGVNFIPGRFPIS